ncbi:hypothetical protein [Micromonospora sp. NPDC005206]|uniref:hypothetical protein n=1 Tax=Micromonospora sp. NPDC005206 TaxID=3157022 RepID=UPI0033B6725E
MIYTRWSRQNDVPFCRFYQAADVDGFVRDPDCGDSAIAVDHDAMRRSLDLESALERGGAGRANHHPTG